MIYSIEEIKKRIIPIARKYNLKAVYLFGSYARNEADENSDIDLIVDTNGTSIKGLVALGALYCDLEDALKKNIDLITVNSLEQESYMKSEKRFKEVVKSERVVLYAVA